MSFLTGKGSHRKRDNINNQWQSDSESEPQKGQDEDTKLQGSSNAENHPEIEQSIEEQVTDFQDFESLRTISRDKYLTKRSQTKTLELGDKIKSIEEIIANKGQDALTKSELEDYQRKKQIYNLIKEREELKNFQIENEYQLLPDISNDRKRKLEVLNHKVADNEQEEEVKESKKRYDSQWEKDQLSRVQVSSHKPDEIQLPGQENYEFVFDESQYVQFEEDKETALQGDQHEDNKVDTIQGQSNHNFKFEEIQKVRKSLPVYKLRAEFLRQLSENQVIVVVGETGSGKTTQLPQYMHEAGYSKGNKKIGCTQPRRVAATSVAQRVADEMGCQLGDQVGYSIRFEDKTSELTKIKYLTDGMLLREFLTDPELSNYGALMIDEAHERTVSTEIILSLIKDILTERKDFKLVVASATINADKFSKFFNNAPIFKIPGRRFPVDIHYTKNPEANYIQAAITTVFQIHLTQKSGDILVFLTGQEEIETMQESLEEAHNKMKLDNKLLICSIYANLPPEQQQQIFEPTPPGTRKVVLATNIAETSITIEGISFVIDPGYVKENVFNPQTGMESLVVVPCSRASADQRAGRAGRLGPGKCFRLYTKWSFYNELQANPTPEILRVNLISVVLLLVSLGVTDLIGFDFMDPPSPETLIKSLELLYALGALNAKGGLTKVGRFMVGFPINPMFAKCLITSFKYNVADEVLSIIALLGESGNLFYRPKDKKEAADKCKNNFNDPNGDHLSLLNIWNAWVESGYSSQWCQDNFIQYKTMKRARKIREQLCKLCNSTGLQPTDFIPKDKNLMIQKAITSGFFSQIARLSQMGDSYRTLKKNQTINIHPSSSIFQVRPPPKLLLYHELVLTSKEFMRNCMLIDSNWLTELAPHYYNEKEIESIAKKTTKFKSLN